MGSSNNHQYNHVYYVEGTGKRSFNLIAIEPRVIEKRIEWQDTSRGVCLNVINVTSEENEEKISILTREGEIVILTLLTLHLYNEKVKRYVAGSPEFCSTEEIQQYYLTTNFDLY